MAVGMGVLRLPPAAFWGMTLKEFAALLRGAFPGGPDRIERCELGALMRRYPDG